jgi:CRISPR-associated protein Csd1
MSWIRQLHETYGRCIGNEPEGAEPLMPICHTTQQAQIEVVVDEHGVFKRASVLDKGMGTTMIPCTEASGGRAGAKPVIQVFPPIRMNHTRRF